MAGNHQKPGEKLGTEFSDSAEETNPADTWFWILASGNVGKSLLFQASQHVELW